MSLCKMIGICFMITLVMGVSAMFGGSVIENSTLLEAGLIVAIASGVVLFFFAILGTD